MGFATIIAIASFLLSAGSMVWIGGFRFSALLHKVDALSVRNDKLEDRIDKRFEKLEGKIDRIEIELHKIDVRVSILEKNRF